MKTVLPFLLAMSVVGGAVLVACSSDTGDARVSFDADAGPSLSQDSGIFDAAADARSPFDATPPKIECAVTPCMTAIVAGPTHYCATATDGTVRCWGNPTAIGASALNSGATPGAIHGVVDVVDVQASAVQTCVVLADGGVDCFGQDAPEPTRIAAAPAAKKIAVGDERSCAVGVDGRLSCWGDSAQTGKGAGPVALAENAIASAMGLNAAFAIGDKGTLFSWGGDPYLFGRDTALTVDWTPGIVEHIGPTLQVAVSELHACAVTVDGRLFCWGRDDNGGLGLGSIHDALLPTEVIFAGPAYPSQVAVSTTHSCVRMTDQSLACWARANKFGQLGYVELTGVFIPTAISLSKGVAAVAVGNGSTCALLVDGSVQCWGDNAYGQLGLGQRDSTRHFVPETVLFP